MEIQEEVDHHDLSDFDFDFHEVLDDEAEWEGSEVDRGSYSGARLFVRSAEAVARSFLPPRGSAPHMPYDRDNSSTTEGSFSLATNLRLQPSLCVDGRHVTTNENRSNDAKPSAATGGKTSFIVSQFWEV